MNKNMFKVGDKVSIKNNSNNFYQIEAYADNINEAIVIDVSTDYVRVEFKNGYINSYKKECIELVNIIEKTWKNIITGDILIVKNEPVKILAKIDNIICISFKNNYNVISGWYTIEQLKKNGYTIKQPIQEEKIEELTLEAVCKELGRVVKIVK